MNGGSGITREEALQQLRNMAEAMACKAAAEVYLTLRDRAPEGEERDWLTAQALRWNTLGQNALGEFPA